MSLYINEETNEYPRYIGDIQKENQGWEPDQPIPYPWAEVISTEPPFTTNTQTAKEIFPEKINGIWVRQFQIHDFTEEELEEIKELGKNFQNLL